MRLKGSTAPRWPPSSSGLRDYDGVPARLPREQADLRNKAAIGGQHARTPGIVADLALGLRYFLDFAEWAGTVPHDEKAKLWERGFDAFLESAQTQAAQIQAAEPAGVFLRLLSAAVASGRSHVADPDGNQPRNPERWGWQQKTIGAGQNEREEWQPQGNRIGWVDGEDLYLEPDASYAAAQEFAREQGDSLTVTAHTLRKRLKEKGFLRSTEESRQKLTVRRTLQGTRHDVLHLHARGSSSLNPTGPTGPVAPG